MLDPTTEFPYNKPIKTRNTPPPKTGIIAMTTQATLKAKAATYTNIASSLKKSQMETQTAFLAALLIQGFEVASTGENEVTITNKATGQKTLGMVFGSKVVMLTGQDIKKSGLSMKLNHSVSLNEFGISQNAYVLDLEEGTVKGAKYAYGWVAAEGTEKHITTGGIEALAKVSIVSTKPVYGSIEHFVSAECVHMATDSIARVRTALTSVIEVNGGFVVVEKEPKERKARTTCFNAQECQKGTSAEALRIEKAGAREDRNAYAEAEKEAKADQKRRDLRNAQARKYAKKAERQAVKAAAKAAA